MFFRNWRGLQRAVLWDVSRGLLKCQGSERRDWRCVVTEMPWNPSCGAVGFGWCYWMYSMIQQWYSQARQMLELLKEMDHEYFILIFFASPRHGNSTWSIFGNKVEIVFRNKAPIWRSCLECSWKSHYLGGKQHPWPRSWGNFDETFRVTRVLYYFQSYFKQYHQAMQC